MPIPNNKVSCFQIRRKKLFAPVLLLSFTLIVFNASAERSDKDKSVSVDADRVTVNEATQESVFEGNVVVTQGTLVLHAAKMIIRQSPDGFQVGTAYGAPATFKQKREGLDDYIEGAADRIEYDGKADKIELFSNAQIKRGDNAVKGDYIFYNSVTEFFQITGSKLSPDGKPITGRVHAIIQPKNKAGENTKSK